MATIPAAGHISDSLRTEGEVKADLEAVIASLRQVPGAASVELAATISGGSITPAGGGGIIVVDTEAAAATDDLANIIQTNYPDNACILVRNANAARVVTLKNAATGSGQMLLSRSADAVLDDTKKWMLLQRRGTDWYEVDRSPAPLQMPVLTKSSSFTVGPEHHGAMILCTAGGITVTFPAAATLGNGFTVAIVNSQTLSNNVVLDADGTELIDGRGIVHVSARQAVSLVCTGSNFHSLAGYHNSRYFSYTFASSIQIEAIHGDYHEVGILTGNITSFTINPSGPIGHRLRIRFQQDGTGGRTVAALSGAKIAGSLASAANQASILDITYSSFGLRWEGFWTQIPV